MKKIERVVLIAPHFEEYAYRLAVALGERAEVLLILDAARLNADYAGRIRPEAPRVTIASSRFRTPVELLSLLGHMLRFRPDVVHWQEPSGFIKAVFAATLATVMRPFVRVALTIHDPVPHGGRDAGVARRLAGWRRYTRRMVHRLFVHGPTCQAQYLREYLPAPHQDGRVRLTEHGAILTAEPVPRPGLAFRALMFGRMEAYKGLETLCAASERLAAEGVEFSLHLMGAGPEIDRLAGRFRALPAVEVDNRFVSSMDIIAAIQAADCVLLPYLSATQSGVLAAAFGNGRFVIASRVGGIVDVVEDGVNGLFAAPGDPVSLAEALRRVAGDPALRDRLCDGARRTAAEKLDWHSIAAQLIEDYQ